MLFVMVVVCVDGKYQVFSKGILLIECIRWASVIRYCYSRLLQVAGNCRSCLCVVSENGRSKVVSSCCYSVVNSGVEVYSFDASGSVSVGVGGVIRFMLLNHPLDCAVCDQGGECDLQDGYIEHGGFDSGFSSMRHLKFAGMRGALGWCMRCSFSKCIQCSRCVRFFGKVVSGLFGLDCRGVGSHIAFSHSYGGLRSHLVGCCVDLCPVGVRWWR